MFAGRSNRAAPRSGQQENAGMDVIMPQLGETVTEGTVANWYKKVGDTVRADEPLFEVETDKVTTEIPSIATGVLKAILVEAGATVPVGTVLAVIEPAPK
jgi:2-oxoglutarate dehydrogenase E2 component (dihydrolipoamide succinyltransferase)